MSSRKFQNVLIILIVAILAASMWWKFPTPLTLGLFAVIVIMSWASVIDKLFKKYKDEQRATDSKRAN
jgi:hypothetical protein